MELEERYMDVEDNDENTNVYDELEKLFHRVRLEGEEKGKFLSSSQYGKVDADIVFHERSRATSEFYKSLVKFKEYIETNYTKELWVKGNRYPRQWMMADEDIIAVIKRNKIADVLNYIDRNNLKLTSEEAIELCKGKKFVTKRKSGKHIGEKVEYPYSLILVNAKFYEKATLSLGLTKIAIQKYLQRFTKLGILIRVGKTGKGNKEWLYADGYNTPWKDNKNVKHVFLTKSPAIRKGLMHFKLKAEKKQI
jgi:hypothetical protein